MSSVCEVSGSGSEELKKCRPTTPAVLLFMSGRERKPRWKKVRIFNHISEIPFRLEEEVLFFYLYLAKQIKDHIIKKIKMLDAQSD